VSTEFCRYLVAGLVNTAVGYLAFLIAFRLLDIDVMYANTVSYAIGLLVAYILNLMFVFSEGAHSASAAFRFLIGFCIAYTINVSALYTVLEYLYVRAEIAQLFAMASYTISFYLINKFFVWTI